MIGRSARRRATAPTNRPTNGRSAGPRGAAPIGVVALVSAAALTAAVGPGGVAAQPTAGAHRSAAAGASVPFVEFEAEDAATNGTGIGPGRAYTTLPSEASGRRAVTLSGAGQYVEFTLTAPADAMTVRYSIPDSADGTGADAPIEVDAAGSKVGDLTLTSTYSWFYGSYPFTNDPGAGNPHHFYDDARMMFDRTLAAGTTVRLAVPASGAVAASYTIDLADFEEVGDPVAAPSGALDVTDYGADPTGAADSTDAIQRAVDAGAAQGKPVYIPTGTFTVTDHIIVDDVTLAGAGPWYSVLTGRNPNDATKGVGAVAGTGTFVLQLQTSGAASFDHVTATDVGYANPIYSCQGAGAFQIVQGDGNSGWYTDTPYCGEWPTPTG